ncbi:hypothetical protein N5079_16825 [Planotetraspora sp. A-T 1434]|uniref:hypothetical protein n=1 Tax=Planotetraspora sp. A-T 1434 TaxID=2979219 RepID=UPI0021BFF742|nr:hypothetical protein [Planotetraspora sp. A-T 1434]MCT9931874.1 hypothetical protein [Planotetraspora sp. A-T 1434]
MQLKRTFTFTRPYSERGGVDWDRPATREDIANFLKALSMPCRSCGAGADQVCRPGCGEAA